MIPTPWLFAAAAVALVVWWNGRVKAAGIPAVPGAVPSLPVVPALPAAPMSAPVGGGMSPLLLGAILVPWGLLAWSQFAHRERPDSAPPEPTPALDLRGVWVGPHAAEDAAITHQLLDDLARAIEQDGTLDFDHDGKIDAPRLNTGLQLAELRMRARAHRTGGISLAERQPKAIDAISAYLEQAIGTYGGPLDAAGKRKWIDAFRDVSRAAGAAIGR